MIAALSRRWEATVYSYRDEADLAKQVQSFAVDVMRREQVGDLPEQNGYGGLVCKIAGYAYPDERRLRVALRTLR